MPGHYLDDYQEAQKLVAAVSTATASSSNEENLRHAIENALEAACASLGIAWTAFQLDRTLHRGRGRSARYVDVVHGAVVIEYEPPRCFNGRAGAALTHAREQAEEYTYLLSVEEGRRLTEYVLVAWDGSHVSFGRNDGTASVWDPLEPFTVAAARRLLTALRDNGTPLVHPQLLSALVGPASAVGTQLLPALFKALRTASAPGVATSKTQLLFVEWHRLFGQVVGIAFDGLRRHLEELGYAHSQPYLDDPAAYLFALNTYIALVAKLVAALSLPGVSEDITDASTPVAERVARLDSGQLFLESVMNI